MNREKESTHGIKRRWLYLITDFSYGEEKIKTALKAGVDFVQLREKDITSAEYLKRAKMMKRMTDYFGTRLLINDRIDIALLSGADGVHLGQDDIPVSDARQVLGENAVIGATAKTGEQAVRAQREGADYLGSGAWFPTGTKKDAVPITAERYREILALTAIPNAAVGGITVSNCRLPLECGADGLAVSGGIMGADDITKAVGRFRELLV